MGSVNCFPAGMGSRNCPSPGFSCLPEGFLARLDRFPFLTCILSGSSWLSIYIRFGLPLGPSMSFSPPGILMVSARFDLRACRLFLTGRVQGDAGAKIFYGRISRFRHEPDRLLCARRISGPLPGVGFLCKGSSVRPVFSVPGKGRHRCPPVAGVKAGASFPDRRLRGRLASPGLCPRRFRRAGGAGIRLRRSTRRMSVPLLLRSFAVRIHAVFRVGFAAGGIRRLSGASIPWRRYRAG